LKDVELVTVGDLLGHVSQISHLHGIERRPVQSLKALFLWCIAKLVVVYLLKVSPIAVNVIDYHFHLLQ
jgi:hypothetical protein